MMPRVSKDRPCPVCRHPDWCLLSEDGEVAICQRTESDRRATNGAGWWHFLTERNRKMTTTRPKAVPQKPQTDWAAWAKRRAYPPGANSLDVALNLPAGTTQCLPMVGSDRDAGGGFWTVPMVNGHEKIVGVSRRYDDGSKKSLGNNGLFVPAGWRHRPGPVFVVEGASDTAAMWAAGLCAVGRPSNTGGVGMLLALLSSNDGERDIIVVGENDEKSDGSWPGLSGCLDVAKQLKAGMRRRAVKWSLPPTGYKDAREYLTSFSPDVSWAERGEVLAAALVAGAVHAGEPDVTLGRMVLAMRDAVSQMHEMIAQLQRGMG